MMRLHKGNYVHSTAIIEEGVEIGVNNWIGPYCVIRRDVKIGDNNTFESHCCIGSRAEHKKHLKNEIKFGVEIGSGNTFKEYFSAHCGTIRKTTIGNNGFFMRSSHIAHDAIIEDNVTFSANAVIGGGVTVMEGANLGMGAIVHQGQIIGPYSMTGMGSVVTKGIRITPFQTFAGVPARWIGENRVGVTHSGKTEEQLNAARDRFLKLWDETL